MISGLEAVMLAVNLELLILKGSERLTRVKICGLCRPADIDIVNVAKPDYIGFVFAKSRRQVDKRTAAGLKMMLNPDIKAVGVFVNEVLDAIISLCRENVIDMVQLHGDETEEYICRLKAAVDKPIIKAVRVKDSSDASRPEYKSCDYLLFDSFREDTYGGSGISFDWSLIEGCDKPFFLAGGINQDNIVEAIKRVAPYCIDVSSGVETNGYKDFNKVVNMVNTVRSVSK